MNIKRQYLANISKTLDFAVQNLQVEPTKNNSIKQEVGIEDVLHIEFEYNRSKFHTRDVIIGKIFFLLVRIKIKHMEVILVRKESVGPGASPTGSSGGFNESENISKYEIMDGAPVRGESIPIRLFLAPYDLTPTYEHSRFSVKYFINLVLIDDEDRRYFKNQEILLWRKHYTTTIGPANSPLINAPSA
jgi:vacuolar protein sorting-associated protein 26